MSANRIKYINQKRSTLKTQITTLETLVMNEEVNKGALNARMNRVKQQFKAYEEMHDEIMVLDMTIDYVPEFECIQTSYYALVSKVQSLVAPINSLPTTDMNVTSITVDNNTRRIKLPTVDLPKFDGSVEKWLSFKNAFQTTIDKLTDITDLHKFLYLRDALQGNALSKISIYDVSAENYQSAWKLLLDSYDKKRVLITIHLDAIIDSLTTIQPIQGELVQLTDNIRQHMNMLKTLDENPEKHLLTRLVERVMPTDDRRRWDETLSLENMPTLDQLYTFISETGFRNNITDTGLSRSKIEGNNSKRQQVDQKRGTFKARKGEGGTRIFVTSPTADCLMCKKEKHGLYSCPAFIKMSIQQRWNFVKEAKLCRNCLRAHEGKCKLSHRKQCSRYHNTLLHDSSSKSNKKSEAIKTNNDSNKSSDATPNSS